MFKLIYQKVLWDKKLIKGMWGVSERKRNSMMLSSGGHSITNYFFVFNSSDGAFIMNIPSKQSLLTL